MNKSQTTRPKQYLSDVSVFIIFWLVIALVSALLGTAALYLLLIGSLWAILPGALALGGIVVIGWGVGVLFS